MSVRTTVKKLAVIGALGALGVFGFAGSASADHAGETATADKSEGLADGDTITITVANMKMPGMNTAQIMTANTWPVVGPEAFNLAEFGAAPTVEINPDGTGTFEYAVSIDHGTFNCLEIQCYVVVFQGMGFDSYTAGLPISFASAESAPVTEAPVATEAPVETEAPMSTEAPTEMAVTAEAPTDVAETKAADGDEDGGGSAGIIIGIVVAVVVLGGAGAVLAKRRAA